MVEEKKEKNLEKEQENPVNKSKLIRFYLCFIMVYILRR